MRKAKKLASDPAACDADRVFRELLNELLASEWLVSTLLYDQNPSFGPNGEYLEHLELSVSPSCVHLANRMVETMRGWNSQGEKKVQSGRPIGTSDQDKKRLQAEEIFRRCKDKLGWTVNEAENEAKRLTGIKLAPGTISKAARRHARNDRKAA